MIVAHASRKYRICPDKWDKIEWTLLLPPPKHDSNCSCNWGQLRSIKVHRGRQNGSVAMLATKRSAGVAPEVNLRNPLHAGDKAHKEGNYPDFEPQGRCHQNRSVSGPTKIFLHRRFQKSFTQWRSLCSTFKMTWRKYQCRHDVQSIFRVCISISSRALSPGSFYTLIHLLDRYKICSVLFS